MPSTLVARLVAITLTAGTAVLLATGASAASWDPFETESLIAKTAPEFRPNAGVGCELPSNALSLEKAIDLALCRNPTTRAAWAAAQAQAASLGASESGYLPTVTFSGGETHVEGVVQTGSTARSEQDTENSVTALSWTLVDFNARRSEVANARSLLLAAAHSGSATAQRTVYSVIQAYYGAMATEQAFHANQQTEGNSARSLEIARALQSGVSAHPVQHGRPQQSCQFSRAARLFRRSSARTPAGDNAVGARRHRAGLGAAVSGGPSATRSGRCT